MTETQISPREAEKWNLPIGTIVTPNEVIYPNGQRERISAIRLRLRNVDGAVLAKANPLLSWMDQPMAVDDAADMSSILKDVLARKWHIMGAPTGGI